MADGHGGKRDGAGRKPTLTDEKRLSIGAMCEDLQRLSSKAATDERLRARLAKHTSYQHIEAAWSELNAIPIELRRAVTSGHEADDLQVEDGQLAVGEIKAYLDGDPDDDNGPDAMGRVHSTQKARGLSTAKIMQQVRERLLDEGLDVPISTVQRCWTEFKKISST